FLYDEKPASDKSSLRFFLQDAGDDEDECFESLFNGIVAEGDSTTLRFEGHVDASRCLKEKDDNLSFSMTFGGFFQVTCDSVDLSPYVGKSLGEVTSAGGALLGDVVCNNSTLLVNSQVDVKAAGKITEGDKTIEVNFHQITQGFI